MCVPDQTGYMTVAFDTTARDAMRDVETLAGGDAKAVYYDEVYIRVDESHQNERLVLVNFRVL